MILQVLLLPFLSYHFSSFSGDGRFLDFLQNVSVGFNSFFWFWGYSDGSGSLGEVFLSWNGVEIMFEFGLKVDFGIF